VPERVELWVEAVLNRDELSPRQKPGEHGGVVVTLRAEEDRHIGRWLPFRERNELGRDRRVLIDADAVAAAGGDLRGVGLDEDDRRASGRKRIADRAADAARPNHVNRLHAAPPT
jgi:hypothetical protein